VRGAARTAPGPGTSGYSGTPLAQKLGIRAGSRLYLEAAPSNYSELLAPLPADVQSVPHIDARTDIIHLFATRRTELRTLLRATRQAMRPDAILWVSWPKRAARVPTDITEDVIRELALPMDLVDIKVCAVDATWSGLKLMVRRARRTAPPTPKQPRSR
jgi:hypothetical protein